MEKSVKDQDKPKKKAGRPKFEITEEVLVKAEKCASQGMTKEQIAQMLGITYQTLKTKENLYSSFFDAIKRGQAKGIETVTNALYTTAVDGNTTAQIFYLKNRANWVDRTEVKNEHSGEIRRGMDSFYDNKESE